METEGNENPERLREAKEIAFQIMERYIQGKIDAWDVLKTEIKDLKMGDRNNGKKEKAAGTTQ